MAVIKSLEKIYLLKNNGFLEYYLDGKVGFLGNSKKESEIRISYIFKVLFTNVIPKFENLFGQELKPIKKPMSEVYPPEIDDSPMCIQEHFLNLIP
jgi:hypothetical protein